MFPRIGLSTHYTNGSGATPVSTIDLGKAASDFGIGIRFKVNTQDSLITDLQKADFGLLFIPRMGVVHAGTDTIIRAEIYDYDHASAPNTISHSDRLAESNWVTLTNLSNHSVLFNMTNSRTDTDSDPEPQTAPLPLDNTPRTGLGPSQKEYIVLIRVQDTSFTGTDYALFPIGDSTIPSPSQLVVSDKTTNTELNLEYVEMFPVQYNGVAGSGINNPYTFTSGSVTTSIPEIHIITSDVINKTYLPTLPTYTSEGKLTNVSRQLYALMIHGEAKIQIEGYAVGSCGFCSTAAYKPIEIDQDADDLIARRYPSTYEVTPPYLLPIDTAAGAYPADGVLELDCKLDTSQYNSNFGEIGIWAKLLEKNPSTSLPLGSPTLPATGESFLFAVAHTPIVSKINQTILNFKVLIPF
jgi:hypothetical protein